MKVLNDLLDRELSGSGGVDAFSSFCPHLRSAFSHDPPPYSQAWYGDTFRNLSANPYWLIQCLISNAAKEASGARELWQLAAAVQDKEVRDLLKKHAVDESGHSVLYIALVEVIFPEAVDLDQRKDLLGVSPRFKMGNALPDADPCTTEFIIDQIVQINLGEFRTRLHQLLMEPVLRSICAIERVKKLDAILNTLAQEEREHLRYTTELLDGWCRNGYSSYIGDLVRRRSSYFNELTNIEVGEQRFFVN